MQHFGVCKKRAIGRSLSLPVLLNDKYRQAVRIMKITAVLLLVGTLHVSAGGFSQSITLSEKEAPLTKVFKAIEKQTDYIFFYNVAWVKKTGKVDVQVKDMQLQQVLELLFKNQPITYSITGKMITVFPKNEKPVINESVPPPPIDISGKVVDENGKPVQGVTVTVKGTKRQTLTNENGEFTIAGVEENAVLTFSSVNMEAFAINVGGQKEIFAKLKTKTSELDEVQIIAYGQTTKRFQTGNVTTIKASDIEKQPVSNPLLALEGRVPGLFITQGSGVPGAAIKVRIQGQNSITNGNEPFYVIDGVPYAAEFPNTTIDDILGGNGIRGNGNPLNYINSDDIESIEVLKDADATAIYGSRAANGAILITTKKGKVGPTKFNINFQQGWGKITRMMPMMNTSQYLAMRHNAYENDGVTNIPAAAYDLTVWDNTRYTDWQKVLIGGTSKITNINTSVSGGTANTNYLVSGTYRRETTVFPGDFSDQRGAVHFNLNTGSSNGKFHMQFSQNYMLDFSKLPNQNPTQLAFELEPNAPSIYNADGTLNWMQNTSGTSTWTNPIATLAALYKNKTSNLVTTAIIDYEILPSLIIKTNLDYSNMQTDDFYSSPLTTIKPESRPNSSNSARYGTRNLNSWTIEPQLNYRKNIFKGKLDVLIGSTILQNNNRVRTIYGLRYSDDNVLENIAAAASVGTLNSYITQYKYNALFGRLNYNWKDKYVINLNVRRDGSSRFGSKNQFHNFGSIGGAWLFSNEKFLQKVNSFLSFGKIRASYGTTGNDQIGDYSFMSLYSQTSNLGVPYQGGTGIIPSKLPNPYLQWEETKKLQIGIDLGFIHDKILLSVIYSSNRSSNQLISYVLPSFVGFGSILQNFPATIQNKDWEMTLNLLNIKGKKFSWYTNINLTIPENKVLAFQNIANTSYASGTQGIIVGQPLGIIKAYHYVGVNQSTGYYQVADINGNGTSTPNYPGDQTVLINTLPKFYGGFLNQFQFRGFQLDIFFQFVKQIGVNTFFNNGTSVVPGVFSSGFSNQPTTVLDAWQKPGDNANIAKYISQSNSLSSNSLSILKSSDALYTDASYMRLKNISFSWELPKVWTKVAHLQNCSLYVNGQNLWTETRYKGTDPENQGFQSLPPLRVITVGLKAGL